MDSNNDIGIVTPGGIWFDGKIYSCSLAIRQQWFKLAEHIGGWPVSVQYQDIITDQIHALLQDGTAVKCIRIDHIPLITAEVEAYYLDFQRLVSIRKERKMGKRSLCKPSDTAKLWG